MQAELPPAGAEEFPADEEIYKSDSFRMQCMKVLPCSKRFVHDWTECPFAHPQEKARRRDPRVHNYTGIACPSMKKEGCCAFSDHCPYAHNVFEYWLHPTRYRTQLCNDGSNCKRKICFFAHSLDELRVPACKPFVSPEALASAAAAAAADAEAKRKAATIGSPLSAFAALSPGPSPQRSSLASLDALRSAQDSQQAVAAQSAAARVSGASLPAPPSPSTTDTAMLGSSPADAAVRAALQQLAGAGFSSQETQVIELVTGLLAQDKVSPEQAASILQQMLPADTLSQLQMHLNTPRAPVEEQRGCYSDPLGYRGDRNQFMGLRHSGSFEAAPAPSASPRNSAAALMAAHSPQQAGLSLEQLAAMQAAQGMGFAGIQHPLQSFAGGSIGAAQELSSRMSLESARSSFDTARMSLDNMNQSGYSPRTSLDATYPPNLAPTYSGQGMFAAQLSPVPEAFPMINAPPPSNSWNAGGRFSLDSATDRLSQDMSRLSFEAAARAAPQPTANPYASSFFTPAGGDAAERRMPPLPPVRTAKSPVAAEDDAAAAANAAQQQLLGGTAVHRLP